MHTRSLLQLDDQVANSLHADSLHRRDRLWRRTHALARLVVTCVAPHAKEDPRNAPRERDDRNPRTAPPRE